MSVSQRGSVDRLLIGTGVGRLQVIDSRTEVQRGRGLDAQCCSAEGNELLRTFCRVQSSQVRKSPKIVVVAGPNQRLQDHLQFEAVAWSYQESQGLSRYHKTNRNYWRE